jgi:hypothetical protein
MADLSSLTSEELTSIGVTKLGHRRKLQRLMAAAPAVGAGQVHVELAPLMPSPAASPGQRVSAEQAPVYKQQDGATAPNNRLVTSVFGSVFVLCCILAICAVSARHYWCNARGLRARAVVSLPCCAWFSFLTLSRFLLSTEQTTSTSK